MTAIDDTLNERGARYGDFTDHAAIAQNLQDIVRLTPGWARSNSVQRQALTVILDKIARICNGDPNYDDNWRDIQGYAKLVEDRLPKMGIDLASAPSISVTGYRCTACGFTASSLPEGVGHTCITEDDGTVEKLTPYDQLKSHAARVFPAEAYGAQHTDGSRSGGQRPDTKADLHEASCQCKECRLAAQVFEKAMREHEKPSGSRPGKVD